MCNLACLMSGLTFSHCSCVVQTHHGDLHKGVDINFLACCSKGFSVIVFHPATSLSPHLHHGWQTSRGLPLLSGTRACAGPAGDISGCECHQFPRQVHPWTVRGKPRVHAQQRTARPTGSRLQQMGGGLLWWTTGSFWWPREHLRAVQGTCSAASADVSWYAMCSFYCNVVKWRNKLCGTCRVSYFLKSTSLTAGS